MGLDTVTILGVMPPDFHLADENADFWQPLILNRFQPGVQTQSLSGVEVGDDDHRTVYFAMKRASEFSGHDWAKGRLPRVPQIADMETAIGEARTYFNTLNKRTGETSSKRRKARCSWMRCAGVWATTPS